jgi:hypothetical protein
LGQWVVSVKATKAGWWVKWVESVQGGGSGTGKGQVGGKKKWWKKCPMAPRWSSVKGRR